MSDRRDVEKESIVPEGALKRKLGLPAAMAIGIGTMVGAGIFVFPGLAAGQAGPGAMISFAIGAVVALLVALPASELATALPYSGGAYVYISRALGSFSGFLVGLSQWVGLVFASAFYLIGFGSYVVELMVKLGFSPGEPVALIALSTALGVTGLNLTGTEKTGSLQNGIVLSLLLMLTYVLGYGLLSAVGVIGTARLPDTFAPYGVFPIFSTAALVFTSYLGFVQIATVAGEIKAPSRTLPLAMTGSVLIVGFLYVVTLFVSTTVISNAELGSLGETALVEVARRLLGVKGTILVLGAGLLATLSSANASILSSSRTVYALGKDHLLPEKARTVNKRFGTPHIALLATGLPIAALTLLGRVEVLAEIASLLHLVIYGLLCVSLVALRYRSPTWYAPSFKSPGFPVLPVLGALASFGLIAFMQPLSLLIGGATLVGISVWYAIHPYSQQPGAAQQEPDEKNIPTE